MNQKLILNYFRLKVDVESAYEEEKYEEINIDKAVLEHMKSIHDSLIVDQSASIGNNQPSMNSAKLAMNGYIIFILLSINQIILIQYLNVHLNQRNMSFFKICLFIIVIAVIFCIQLYICFKSMVNNLSETYYVQNLYYRMPFFPYSSLTICTITLLLIFSLPRLTLLIFIVELSLFGILFSVLSCIKKNVDSNETQQLERFSSEADLNSIYDKERENVENSKSFWSKFKFRRFTNKDSYNIVWNNRKRNEIYMSTTSMAQIIEN